MKNTTFPIASYVCIGSYGVIPVLDIRMMDDDRERELAAQSAQKWAMLCQSTAKQDT